MGHSHPFFSVIVPTYERARQVAVCLRALACQSYPRDRFEVLVVDDGSTTSPKGSVDAFVGQLNLRLLAPSWWTWRHRQLEIWILLGVTALFSRFWVYHRLQDDLLIVVPMVSLYRIAADPQNPSDYRARAGVLCAIAWGTIVAPARLLAFATPLPLIMEAMQTAVWLVMLAFLLYHASIALPARFMPHQLVLSDPSG